MSTPVQRQGGDAGLYVPVLGSFKCMMTCVGILCSILFSSSQPPFFINICDEIIVKAPLRNIHEVGQVTTHINNATIIKGSSFV